MNRELDTLKSILSKAVEWGKLLESPARRVKRLKVENRRTRILFEDEQHRLLKACPRKLRAMVLLALVTGARIGEVLTLRWEDCQDGYVTFWKTKNAGDVTLHTLRHTALSRMIADGHDDYLVMEVAGHTDTRMLARYTHPREERKKQALALPWLSTKRAQTADDEPADAALTQEIADLLKEVGGSRSPRLARVPGKSAERLKTPYRAGGRPRHSTAPIGLVWQSHVGSLHSPCP